MSTTTVRSDAFLLETKAMTPLQVTFLHEAPHPLTHATGLGMYDRFIDEVGQRAESAVTVVAGLLRDVMPTEGFVIYTGRDARVSLNECPVERRTDLAARLVPVNVERARIFEELLEPLSLAGAIDGMSMQEWKSWNGTGARGLYGRRNIGQLAGAACLLFESARYCYLQRVQIQPGLKMIVGTEQIAVSCGG